MMKNGMTPSDSLHGGKKVTVSENERDQPRHSSGNDRQRFIDDDDIVIVIFFLPQLLHHSYQKSVFKRNISFRLVFSVFLFRFLLCTDKMRKIK